jgi:hypothetical protein
MIFLRALKLNHIFYFFIILSILIFLFICFNSGISAKFKSIFSILLILFRGKAFINGPKSISTISVKAQQPENSI